MSKRVVIVGLCLFMLVVSFGFSNVNKITLAVGGWDIYLSSAVTQRIINAMDKTGRGITNATRAVDIGWILEGAVGGSLFARLKAALGTKATAGFGVLLIAYNHQIRRAHSAGRGIILRVIPPSIITNIRAQPALPSSGGGGGGR